MTFNPETLGFRDVSSGGKSSSDYCYIRVADADASKRRRNSLSVVLSPRVASQCRDSFGNRVNIAVNDKCQLLIYEGALRALSLNRANGGAIISLNSEFDRFKECLGDFKKYKLDVKEYNGGESIILTPCEKIM